MDIVSIKKYLNPGKPKPEDCVRFLQLLLQGISLHAVDADEANLTRFRYEVGAVSDRLTDQSSAEDILAALSSVIRAMAHYNQTAGRITKAHFRELQAMLAMMTETIAFLGDSSNTGIKQLQTVETNLKKASSIEDVRELRGKLDECLAVVRNESKRLREESDARIAALKERVEQTANLVRSISPGAIDPATGLHGRLAAEELMTANLSQGKQFMVALFLVDKLAHVNARFGRKTGDEVLVIVAEQVGQRLGTNALFRWSGPAFVAIVEIQPSLHLVERQLKQIAAMRIEKTIDTEGRSVLFVVTCSYLLQKVAASDSVDLISRNLDKFVATHAGEFVQS